VKQVQTKLLIFDVSTGKRDDTSTQKIHPPLNGKFNNDFSLQLVSYTLLEYKTEKYFPRKVYRSTLLAPRQRKPHPNHIARVLGPNDVTKFTSPVNDQRQRH